MGVIGWGVVGQGVGTRGSRGADPSTDGRVPGGETYRKGRSACGGQRGRKDKGGWGPGLLMRSQKMGNQGWVGERQFGLLGEWSEQWPKEGVKWKRDRESLSPLRLFKFIVLIDNEFHFFCMGGI